MAKANVYDMVTDRIIAELEKGQIPWQKPWTGIRSGAYNRITKRPYSLLNQMLLQHRGEYATFKQWQDLGGHVRKGAKSEIGKSSNRKKLIQIQEKSRSKRYRC